MKTWLAEARLEADHALADAVRTEGRKVTCRGQGCWGCCQGPVFVVADEVEAILEAGLDGATKQRIEDYQIEKPCPLLDPVSKRCLAYANRPLTCRVFVSTSPPEWCSDPKRALRAKRPRLGLLVQRLYGARDIGILGDVLREKLLGTTGKGPSAMRPIAKPVPFMTGG